LLLFFALIIALNVLGLYKKRLTYDEGAHYKYGMNILSLNSDRFDDSKMPFSTLNALPRKIWDVIGSWKWTKPLSFLRKMRTGKSMTGLFSLILGFFVFKWVEELYGTRAGFFSLFLYVFEPNILAHSRLITTDLYAAGMTTIALYYFWKFHKLGGRKNAFISAVTLALSQLAKYTCIYLYPIFFLIAGFNYFHKLIISSAKKRFLVAQTGFKVFLGYVALSIITSILVINVGFLFNKSFVPLKNYSFQSDLFQSLQTRFPSLIMPLPYPYVQGLDQIKFYDQEGKEPFYTYLLGELRKGKKFIGYYFYAFLFKEPIATQLLVLLSFVFYVRNHKKYNFFGDELFLFVPTIFFTIYFNFFFRVQMGMRFFIVVLPVLFIFCGNLFKNWRDFGRKSKIGVGLLSLYLIGSVLSYTPHYLSYFNEFLLDRKKAYKILADSNVDWGENTWYLERYRKRHPDAIVSPDHPVAGKIIVSINDLVGLTDQPAKYKWLRNHFEPTGHIAYSYLVYDISTEALKSIV